MPTRVEKKKHPFAVALFGPPGSGKSTQAVYIEKRFGAVHIDTGRIIEKAVYDPRMAGDPILRRERKIFDSGILNTPEWVVGIIQSEIKKHASRKTRIVLSGSPRTLFEAERIIPFLETLYGKKFLLPFRIRVRPETSLFRNSNRVICVRCGMPQIYHGTRPKQCRECGGNVAVRSFDTPKAIRVRLKEYEKRTKPIVSYFKKHGFTLFDINGEQSPEAVFGDVSREIKKALLS